MVITAAAHSEWRHHTNFIRFFQHGHLRSKSGMIKSFANTGAPDKIDT
jgi:hypothetical protein